MVQQGLLTQPHEEIVTVGEDETAETMAARPGWDAITAIAEGHVVELDDDIASRWGPRMVDLLRTIIEATSAA